MDLPRIAVNRPITILMIFLAVVILGSIALTRLPIELWPSFGLDDISIFVNIRGGIPPEEVEAQVSKPIEEAVGTVSHLRNLISISEEGRSRVVMRFEPKTDMDYATLEVREKFSRIRSKLPKQIEKPVIAKFEEQDRPILITAVTGGINYTPEMLRKIVDETIKEQILRVEGVANVDVGGGRERKILVEVDQHKLQAYRLPIGRVINALNLNNVNMLLGELERKKQKYLIRILGGFRSIDDIKQIGVAVTPSGSVIKIEDVAEIKDSYLEATSYARVGEKARISPVVSLYIQKESQANTVEVISKIQKVKQKLTTGVLDKKIKLIDTFNQANIIIDAIDNAKKNLIYGALFAIIILWLFLRDSRSTIIIGIAIPIAVVATFAFMFFAEIKLNIVTLIGLALSAGMLLDSSIVVLENILRLREESPGIKDPSIKGCREVMLAIFASIITTIVVFIPIFFTKEAIISNLYKGMSLNIIFSLLFSFLIATTLVPMLSARLPSFSLRRKDPHFRGDKPQATKKPRRKILLAFRKKYRMILGKALRWRYAIIGTSLALFIAAVLVIVFVIDKEFIGITEQQDFTIFIELPTGAKLDISDKAVKDIEEILQMIPEVEQFSSRVEKWSSKVYVRLLPLIKRVRTTKEIIDDLRTKVEGVEQKYRKAFIYFEEPQEVETNEIIIEIFGHNYQTLNELAIAMLTRMQAIGGLDDLKIRWRKGRPEWLVKVSRQKASLYGFTVDDIANTVHAQMRGLRATLYHTKGKEVEVIARLQEKDRRTLDALRKLTLVKPDGTIVYLDQMAEFEPDVGPSKIWRKNKSRMIQISANKGDYTFGTAAKKIKNVLADMKMPEDYYYNFGENYWSMIRVQREFFAIWPLGIFWLVPIFVYLVLASIFESYIQPFIIMITEPLAVIGVASALWISKIPINISVYVGVIMLIGIAVNNAIILVDYINRLRKRKIAMLKSIINASMHRLRPIMITTCTTIAALLPMALDRNEHASLWAPLAITVVGGLISSTILTLLIVPSMYLVFEDIRTITRRRFLNNRYNNVK